MKEVVSIEESSDVAMKEDVKKLEDTMAVEGIAPMITRSVKIEDEEVLSEIVSRGMPETPAPSEPANVLEEYAAEVEIEGVGIVKFPITPVKTVAYSALPVVKTKTRVFNSGLNVIKTHIEKVPITVPSIIINVCNSLQKKVDRNEFSIVCKGHWGEDGNYIVSEEYRVPKQKVDGAAVDYDLDHLEQLKMEGFNTVVHSHPFKSSNFSQVDDETINSHFECSILYSVGEFTTATIAIIPIPGTKLIVTGDPRIDGVEYIVPESESNNIEKKYKYQYNDYNRSYGDDYWYGWGGKNRQTKFHGSDPIGCEKEYDKHVEKEEFRKYNNDNMFGTRSYDYDVETNVLYKNGKPIHNSNTKNRIARQPVSDGIKNHIPIQTCGCACSESTISSERVFRTDAVSADQRSGVFKTTESSKNNQKGKKNRKDL